MDRIILPQKVRQIIETLETRGYEAYAVGGCIRDSLIGRTPGDWDITSSASPMQVKDCFRRTFDTGIAHGTVTVVLGEENFEVTTFRIDGDYSDSRHPDHVAFTSSLTEDLRRRDFTINAMAYNESRGLVDLFGGREDLKFGIIRAVGDPRARFGEDALRMLRAVRFAGQLGFTLDEETARAIREMAPGLEKISAERIRTELEKLAVSPHPDMLRLAWQLGMTAHFLPEFDSLMGTPQNNAHHIYNVGEHTLKGMLSIEPDKILRLAMLFHDIGKPEVASCDENGIYHHKGHAAASAVLADRIMRRLKFDNHSRETIDGLVKYHSCYPEETPEGVRRYASEMGPDLFALFLKVKRADILAQSPQVWEKKLAYLDRIEELFSQIMERGDCLSLKTLAVSGKELKEAGIKSGPEMGDLLRQLLGEVLADPSLNNREYLIERALSLQGK